MDLAALKTAFAKPWAKAHKWPILRWLDPDFPVRLWRDSGAQETWMAGQSVRPGAGHAQFDAVELPSDLFLARQLALPAMSSEQLAQAIELDVKTLSPFSSQDLVWGYASNARQGGGILAHIALASRPQVDAYLAARKSQLSLGHCEVWAVTTPGMAVVLPGWSETLRQRRRVVRRRMGFGLLALVVFLSAAALLTPVAQLRLRAIEAAVAHSELQGRAAVQLAQREAMQQAVDRIGLIKNVLAERADGVLLLDTLTKILPDDTYLGTLDVTGLKVRIVGLTTNAAALMQSLGAQNGFRDVRAPVPAVRNPGATLENFNIEFQLDPAVFSVAAAPGLTSDLNPQAPVSTPSPNAPPVAEGGAPAANQASPVTGASAPVAPVSKSRFSSGGDTRPPVKPVAPDGGK